MSHVMQQARWFLHFAWGLVAITWLSTAGAVADEVPEYRWSKVTDRAAYAPRDGAGALVFKNRMWLLGGWNPGDKRSFPRICNNEVWSSADGADWVLEKPN